MSSRIVSLIHRPPFGAHGHKVVVALCGWELVSLHPRVPLPTLSQVVKRFPGTGAVLLALLAQHWYLEDPTRVLPVEPRFPDPVLANSL